jgi:hypothetical protein
MPLRISYINQLTGSMILVKLYPAIQLNAAGAHEGGYATIS